MKIKCQWVLQGTQLNIIILYLWEKKIFNWKNGFEKIIWRWLFHPSTSDQKKVFFDPPKLVMVLWPNRLSWEDFRWYFLMSNNSGGTHMDHASRPKFSFLKKKCVKNYHILRAASRAPEGASEFCFRKYFYENLDVQAGLRRGRLSRKLTSFSQLPDCSSPDFCQKMNFNSFHEGGVWKNE